MDEEVGEGLSNKSKKPEKIREKRGGFTVKDG